MSCKFLHNYTAYLEEIYANQNIFLLLVIIMSIHSAAVSAFCCYFCAFLSLSVCFLAHLWERDYFHSPYKSSLLHYISTYVSDSVAIK